MKVISLLPARIGSNRVILKNLRLLNSKPLISYNIETLKKSAIGNDVYINSDSEIFHEIANQNNINFYHRKKELATSSSLIDDYLYDFMTNVECDYLAVVNPTSPFINVEFINSAWSKIIAANADTLLSYEKIQTHCFIDDKPINFNTKSKHPRSQDLEPVKALNFAISIWKVDTFIESYVKNGHGVYSGNIVFHETEGWANIDIDYEEDFQFAEMAARFLESNSNYEKQYTDEAKEILKTRDPRT